jgi:hypothetical protein
VRFHDTVRVESEPCPGKVRVTISFENWKEGMVAPATFELEVPKLENRSPTAEDTKK